jgi:hypothetical protein
VNRAALYTAEGEPGRALPLLRRVLAKEKDATPDASLAAQTRFELARALWAAQRKRPEVLRLLAEARPLLESEHETAMLARLDAWAQAQGLAAR